MMGTNELGEFFSQGIRLFEELCIPYVVTGSFATFRYGYARTTNDMDVIFDPNRQQLEQFVLTVQETAMAELDVALDAFQRRAMFNIIDFETVDKIDLIFLTLDSYEQEKFRRRRKELVFDISMFLVTPEDAIVSKLRWARGSMSEMQMRDVAGIMATQWDQLDWEYVEHWVEQLGLQIVFLPAKSEAESRI